MKEGEESERLLNKYNSVVQESGRFATEKSSIVLDDDSQCNKIETFVLSESSCSEKSIEEEFHN